MSSLEEKEVKITSRILVAIIFQTAVIVATACGFYFTLKSDIRDGNTRWGDYEKLMEERFKSVQLQNNIYEKQLEGLQIQVDELRINKTDKK